MTPKVLLLDLDGVLRRFGSDDAIEDAHGLPRGRLAEVAFGLAGPALVGADTDAAWRALVRGRLVADGLSADVARSAVAAWSRVGELVPEAIALVRRVRCRVAVLTNATDRLPVDLARLGLDREVDAVVSSAVIGAVKPAPEAYLRALDLLGVEAADVVFCDDKAENAAGARAVGIDGVHTPDYPALEAAVADRGLLGPLLLVLHDRDEAVAAARELADGGWAPALVHKDLLAGEDDVEDADWVVELATGPDGRSAHRHRDLLETVADRVDGFVTD
ncbi:hypothetical protein GCM10022243_07020 [Saccharothrix violaceirubra]|uniref:HAD superfamily hydrolase (TIGR01509 family) n=1 Tax=Saccharothrix violaceirubra TaxID=413306 RepID=A0A7W7SY67_9PSEU|nr:HAD-IA family hydrolase [Saccharothrix violaceirubra]MBB4963114.1 HAD superfamily hydrolase (TIGR01509 family) [Saccharothrix violaceirubra]